MIKKEYPSVDKPWLQYYDDEAINGDLPELTLYEYLVENNKENCNRTAINYLGKKISFGSLFKNIQTVAQGFTALGVRKGDIVTIALPSVPEALYSIYALNRIGAIANMVHPLAGKSEIINYITEVKSEVCVVFDKTYENISDSLESINVKHAIIVSADNSMPFPLGLIYKLMNKKSKATTGYCGLLWNQFVKKGINVTVPNVCKNVNEVAVISHTGGTTGEPKGVMCSDRNINALIWQVIHTFSLIRDGIILAVLPPFVNYSLVSNMIEGLVLGFEVVLIPKYEPEKFYYYVMKYRPTYIHTIPAYLEAALKDSRIHKADLSSIIQMYYGGESMDHHVLEAVNELFLSRGMQNRIGTGLGATESVSAATTAVGRTMVPGSVGAPLPRVNCKIVEPGTQNELTYMQEGEICFSGDTIMLGYYKNKAATDDIIKIHSDGLRWLHTGDLGYINQDGILFVSGRIKRLIMTRDMDSQVTKIFPNRVEKIIMSCPLVESCCVIGIPDEQYINRPVAVVLLKDEYTSSKETSEQILSVCRDNLPSYMVPHLIEYRDSLPRTERGKVDFRALEEELANS